ncbi:hypothetical protein RJZ56_004976 [Blastomyces dermatitidis]|uniref:Atos-like conserved domain-containing protein n=2 Tax=Ajellomyces dermatitidis TaxID=5039 RepID=F2TEM7_AJEDA|nr:uncharacterized protein BDCG_03910 [Blastomyces dermatitidis ER-3]EEQ88790.1 hypothetical protein BDCG_03910 [Blastomyces dermatitidis ER-3]EGE81804.1 hypothetical protein BDDG_04747 [Blastomyces dermatitidis ATCC 18188]EQL30098.1 hypothetical protein BDFG_07387 [Blastomyces dermatitidis ATCC 26199]
MPIFKDQERRELLYHHAWPASCPDDDDDIKPTKTPKQGVESLEEEVIAGTSSWRSNMEAHSSPQRLQTSDREELIRSIKKGESPTWVPNRSLEEYFATHGDPPHSRLEGQLNKDKSHPLLPATNLEESFDNGSKCEILTCCPSEIERPRSALHSGDFREGSPQDQEPRSHEPFEPGPSRLPFGSSPTTPWYTPPSPPAPTTQEIGSILVRSRARAPSLNSFSSLSSFSSSFILKAPTSPLVHQANNTDLDFSPKTIDPLDLQSSPEKANRRRTLPAETFTSFQYSPPGCRRGANVPTTSQPWRREATFPYQAHQPRRSLTSACTLQPASSPQTPFMGRSRRPSFATDISSPLHHASMVGSYEESILRGRMSTTPSKPLDFTAQIGVLGRGNCKPSLKCPPHVTVPFPAVFYSYPTSGGGRSISDDSPSPYVGFIDIENSFPKEDKSNQRTRRRYVSPPKLVDKHLEVDTTLSEVNTNVPTQQEWRRREKRSRRSPSPKAPPGGCYRIPQQGQLQIIIKNPNKTAVKLFLVPYDLEGMEPGTKTFIRQRSYSAGPIIDMPLSARTNSEAYLVMGDSADKPVLRYLIHLNICCPSRGRFYLYSGIRVVFANRVPDGKEKLRNEVQYPDPQYSPYKPAKEINKLTAENAIRHRSSGYRPNLLPMAPMRMSFDNYETSLFARAPPVAPLETFNFNLPVHMSGKASPYAPDYQDTEMEQHDLLHHQNRYGGLQGQASPNKGDLTPLLLTPRIPSPPPPDLGSSTTGTDNMYSKRQRGDVGYGSPFRMTPMGHETGASLLARKLRRLDVVLGPDLPDEK